MGAITQREIENISINLFKKMGLVADNNTPTHTFKAKDYVYCFDEEIGHILIGRVGYLPVGWDANSRCVIAMVEDKSQFDLKLAN
ncbi:hypothetical protein CP985_14115 [Malaciobacter mytili LMG 24559]|uniref:Uncharacterized protein n=1 Tax=Malaciobacter mytili LMG 24559 TaxID=1032238 RepID=A0AAX2AEN0_9BACT|nr:hypothetical protein [Malaciobacter mytili]AXH16480.1 hypothetical protein AMYT_a0182 [Malaciobacter mytili LMG 24559]RXK12882.1 hypothetical protein CP985_14115 [Malaciobacter mytili LMG 24559]